MGAVATILPLVLEGFKMLPGLVNSGIQVYEGIRNIWEGVSSEYPPTAEEQKKYDDAMEEAFQNLMKSTEDVKK